MVKRIKHFDKEFEAERKPLADLEYALPKSLEEDEDMDDTFEDECTCAEDEDDCPIHENLAFGDEEDSW